MRKLNNSELNRKSVEEFKRTKKNPFIVILDNIRSLNNIGSVFRTADGFLIQGVYLCGITATPPHKDIRKTALGATDSVEWKYFNKTADAIEQLKKEGYRIIAIEQTDESIMLNEFNVQNSESYALIFGHEMKGVDQSVIDISDVSIEIPQYGTKHSFNISVSVGIVLWDLVNKLKKKRL
ncbi:MAG: RNA methyltransferase [Bacteroidales bacterium]|nr:MAG: RNA methyltransferase [Bacteroidales bacterium]